MKIIKITSKGEIDERAFSLLGASSKRDDNTKIGMFGSGLKYSLAYLLRKEIKFKVFSGYREVKFTTEEEIFRDKSFNRIYVNGKETSLTTDMGMDWQHWFVMREIYCNALDESEGSITIEEINSFEDITPIEDFTSFFISVDEDFNTIINNWDDYFSENRKDLIFHDDKFNQIYAGGEKVLIYRKGIRCHSNPSTKALFHYDMSWININESRIIADDYEFRYNLVKFLKEIKDEKIVHRILYNINDYWEKYLYWDCSWSFSDSWKNIIDDKYLIPFETAGLWDEEMKLLKGEYIVLPQSMIKSLKITFGADIKVIGENGVNDSKGDKKVIEALDKKQSFMIKEATTFLKEAGFDIKYPIKIVKFHNPNVLGQADDSVIYLSEKLFNMGKRKLAAVIIEENEHNSTGWGDETREFQSHFIDLYLSSLEDKVGIYL
jgi:hypothetical protein